MSIVYFIVLVFLKDDLFDFSRAACYDWLVVASLSLARGLKHCLSFFSRRNAPFSPLKNGAFLLFYIAAVFYARFCINEKMHWVVGILYNIYKISDFLRKVLQISTRSVKAEL